MTTEELEQEVKELKRSLNILRNRKYDTREEIQRIQSGW
jgi:hypothetical protein